MYMSWGEVLVRVRTSWRLGEINYHRCASDNCGARFQDASRPKGKDQRAGLMHIDFEDADCV